MKPTPLDFALVRVVQSIGQLTLELREIAPSLSTADQLEASKAILTLRRLAGMPASDPFGAAAGTIRRPLLVRENP